MFHLEPLVPGPRPSVPNGSTQHFTWSTQWLHLSQRLLSTFFKQLLFCSLQTLSFSWWESFTTRGPILNPTKTENEFPSKGKPQIPGEDIPTVEVENLQRSHQNRKLHDDFDWTFRCLGVRTSLQLRARCHCHLGPWSPNAGATLKTPQKITKQE